MIYFYFSSHDQLPKALGACISRARKIHFILVISSMNSEESLVLNTVHVPLVRLHATALFGILNSHARREDRNSRVIGTLLGVQSEGFIDVRTPYMMLFFTYMTSIRVTVVCTDLGLFWCPPLGEK